MEIIKARDVRSLELSERAPQLRKLESFLKGLKIDIKFGNTSVTKQIRYLVPNVGQFQFPTDRGDTDIQVS
jgi:hypothetical protein